jgi:hypothetical protein
MAGKPQSVDGVRILGVWQFSLAGDNLKITGNRPYSGLNVLVERKDENDGIIEASDGGEKMTTLQNVIDRIRPVSGEWRQKAQAERLAPAAAEYLL